MRVGAQRFIVQEDLDDLTPGDASGDLGKRLQYYWDKEVATKKKYAFIYLFIGKRCSDTQMYIIYCHIRPSVWCALFYAYGGPYAFAAFLKVFSDLLQFAQPQLLRFLLAFIASYQRDPAHTSILPGLGWCAALFLTALSQTAILHQYFQICFVTGSRVRAGLIMVIYNKSLKLSNEDDNGTKEDGKDKAGEKKEGRRRGDVVNLMSVDTTRMQDLCTYALIIASGPFQVCYPHPTRNSHMLPDLPRRLS